MITHKQNGVHSERCCQEVDYQLAQLRKVNKQLVEALYSNYKELVYWYSTIADFSSEGGIALTDVVIDKAKAALAAAKEVGDE